MQEQSCWQSRLAAVALVLAAAGVARAEAPRPSIVVILSDDMGFSDVGCYGSEIETPAIDRLAIEGLLFTQFKTRAAAARRGPAC